MTAKQKKTSQPPVKYGVTEASLKELADRYSQVPDANTEEGYEEIKSALKVITPLRTGIETKRKELKADALAWGKKVDAEAKRITLKIVEVEEPFKLAKQEVDERKKREKEERLARLQQKVDALSAYPQTAFGQSSAVIAQLIEDLDAHQIADYYDLSKQAEAAKQASMTKLVEMMQAAIAQEQADERRRLLDEELAEERKEMAARKARLDAQEEALALKESALEESTKPDEPLEIEDNGDNSGSSFDAPKAERLSDRANTFLKPTPALLLWKEQFGISEQAFNSLLEVLNTSNSNQQVAA